VRHYQRRFAVHNDGDVEYSKHLVEEQPTREKPYHRQQNADVAQVARQSLCDVGNSIFTMMGTWPSCWRDGRGEHGMMNLPD
jgi:hypothetical protein